MRNRLVVVLNGFSSLKAGLIALGFTIGMGALWLAPALAQNHYTMPAFMRCTGESEIVRAFQLLKASQGERSLQKIVNKPIRVVFKDMRTINKALKNYDALSWMNNQGEQVIFVNEKHRQAPPEALAALIAHEAMHDDAFNSLSEEVESWQFEAKVWMELKAKSPALAQVPRGINALIDRENRIEKEARQGTLEKFVRSSPGYQGLPETSPGFGDKNLSHR
jgi:hypothetical protein